MRDQVKTRRSGFGVRDWVTRQAEVVWSERTVAGAACGGWHVRFSYAARRVDHWLRGRCWLRFSYAATRVAWPGVVGLPADRPGVSGVLVSRFTGGWPASRDRGLLGALCAPLHRGRSGVTPRPPWRGEGAAGARQGLCEHHRGGNGGARTGSSMNLGTACGTSKDRFIRRSRVRGILHGHRSRCRACSALPHPSPPFSPVAAAVSRRIRFARSGMHSTSPVCLTMRHRARRRCRMSNMHVLELRAFHQQRGACARMPPVPALGAPLHAGGHGV